MWKCSFESINGKFELFLVEHECIIEGEEDW